MRFARKEGICNYSESRISVTFLGACSSSCGGIPVHILIANGVRLQVRSENVCTLGTRYYASMFRAYMHLP